MATAGVVKPCNSALSQLVDEIACRCLVAAFPAARAWLQNRTERRLDSGMGNHSSSRLEHARNDRNGCATLDRLAV